MKKRLVLASVVAGLFCLAVTFFDPFLLFFLLGPLVPGIIVVGALLAASWRTGPSRSAVLTISAIVIYAVLVALAIPTNQFVHDRAEAAAKAYPARIEPLLEAYRQVHGLYPTTLEQLPNKPSVPRLLRRSHRYRSNGNAYFFRFPKPGGLIDEWHYDSTTKEWHLST